jgi:tRNA modification GTPase
MTTSDTIAAIATAPGSGGIGIIRISGAKAPEVLGAIFRPNCHHDALQSHRLYYGTVISREQKILDEVLAVYMRAPATYTTEDVVEIHCHGSYLVLSSILAEILRFDVRAAQPGEFTKRAFLGGRVDLTKAEAVVDLITAESSGAVRLAVDQMQGSIAIEVEQLRRALMEVLAVLEVAIDFPDDDVEIVNNQELATKIRDRVVLPLTRLLQFAEQGKVLREGVKVVIIGRPNVGKSSLLNGLLQEDRALVTKIPGTTRDTIEEIITIQGVPIHLVDTAGIREHADQVEEMGIARARRKVDEADLVLFVVDASEAIGTEDELLFQSLQQKKRIVVLNKMDKATSQMEAAHNERFRQEKIVQLSAKSGQNLHRLQEAIYQSVAASTGLQEQPPCAPNIRHRVALTKVGEACDRVIGALEGGEPVDLVAVEVQSALVELGDVVGLTTPDDVLETIFSSFCIGK